MRTLSVFCVMLCGFLLAGWTSLAWASPMPPAPTVNVTGTVVEATWTPAATKPDAPEGDPNYVHPACFKVLLKDAEVEMVKPTGNKQWDGPTGKLPEYRLRIQTNDKELLKPGMKIKVVNYRGDRGAIWSRHGKVEILSTAKPAGK